MKGVEHKVCMSSSSRLCSYAQLAHACLHHSRTHTCAGIFYALWTVESSKDWPILLGRALTEPSICGVRGYVHVKE